MNTLQRLMRSMIERLYLSLLTLYPNHFRTKFNDEIQEIFLKTMIEAEEQGGFSLFNASIREFYSLGSSIIKERWHELKSRKDKVMTPEENLPDGGTPGGGGASSIEVVGMPGLKWIPKWVMLTTASFPAALILMAPLAAALLLILNLGVNTGILSSFTDDLLPGAGFFMSLSLTLAVTQWLLLRNYLPRAQLWLLATAAGVLISGIFAGVGAVILSNIEVDPIWGMVVLILPIGIVVGFAQWLVLRQIIPNAYWIVAIDLAAVFSLLLIGRSITNLMELLIIPMLPGVITGLGLWILLSELQPRIAIEVTEIPKANGRRSSRKDWIGFGLAALVPIFFLCLWIYAVSQLALAKNDGIYASAEEAVIMLNSQGWGGAEVVRLEDVGASINRHDGSQPHVWFGGARVYLDRVPQGRDRTEYSSGSYFLHVKEGWVHVPEGAFPEFIGWIMELYGLEGVKEWTP